MKRILTVFLFIILCTFLAFGVLELTYTIFGVGPLDTLGMPGYALLLAAFILLGASLSHLGSVLGGLVTGWKLAEFSLFGFGLHRDGENRLRLMHRRSGRIVQSLMTPPRLDGSSPFGGIHAGHVLLNAVSGAVLMLLACLLRSVRIMPAIFLMGGFLVMLALLNAFRVLPVALRLRGNVHLRRAYEVNSLTSAANRRDVSISSLPEEAFVPFPTEALTDPQVFVAQCNTCTRLLNSGEYARARALMQELSDVLPRPQLRLPDKPVWSQMLLLNGAIAEMMTGSAPLLSDRLGDGGMKIVSTPGWHKRLLLARYLRALLVTGDKTDAANQLAELTSNLDAQPADRTAGTRRILKDAQRMAAERNTDI